MKTNRRTLRRLAASLLCTALLCAQLAIPAGAEEPDNCSSGLDLTKVSEDKTYTAGSGTAEWDASEHTLTLTDATIDSEEGNGIIYTVSNAPLTVIVEGTCTISGGTHGIVGFYGLTVEVGPWASLTVSGSDGAGLIAGQLEASTLEGPIALQVTVAENGQLNATGHYAIQNSASPSVGMSTITLANAGTLTAVGTDAYGVYTTGSVSLSGGGFTRCTGSNYGVYSETGITVAPEVQGLASGSSGGLLSNRGTVTNSANTDTFLDTTVTPTGGDTSPDQSLDLSSETTDTKLYTYDKGMVLWEPTESPAKLTITGNGLYLDNGLTLPTGDTEIIMSANTEISNGEGPAITVSETGGSLTFSTSCMDWSSGPSLYSDALTISGADAVSFVGGYFRVYGGAGAVEAPVTVEKGVGMVELSGGDEVSGEEGETHSAPATTSTVTVDPTNVMSRGGYHAELTIDHPDNPPQKSNSALSYEGTSGYVMAAILEGETTDPLPGPGNHSSHDDGPSTYQVVYHPGYGNGPQPIRVSGYQKGAQVSVRENPFDAPTGKVFAGWSETEGGNVAYQAGDTFSMPGHMVTLYAIWQDDGPALNKTDHTAYLQGYPDGQVKPSGWITREQTAVIFYRLLDQDSRTRYHQSASPFPDVADSRWSAEAIATMANAEVLMGFSDGTFAPERPITRAQFAAIAARFDSSPYEGPDLFPDIAGHWAAVEINRAAQKGWVKGGDDGLFHPDEFITRAQAATLINRVLERAPETAADLLTGMKTFPDNADNAAWYYLDLQEAANGHEYDRKDDGVHETWTALTDPQ